MSALDLLASVPTGPLAQQRNDMLLRAIQLFADGERAVSLRQAIISYIGSRDTLFGRKGAAEQYTCTGMALRIGGDFKSAYEAAKWLILM